VNEGKIEETIEGTPQGGVASPLLANIYLHEMDKQVSAMDDVQLVRYADDRAPRSCIGDEGRFLGVGLQGAGFKSPQAAKTKSLMW